MKGGRATLITISKSSQILVLLLSVELVESLVKSLSEDGAHGITTRASL
jgi:hypothetical protein